jgi:hypothetical protein
MNRYFECHKWKYSVRNFWLRSQQLSLITLCTSLIYATSCFWRLGRVVFCKQETFIISFIRRNCVLINSTESVVPSFIRGGGCALLYPGIPSKLPSGCSALLYSGIQLQLTITTFSLWKITLYQNWLKSKLEKPNWSNLF